MDLRLTFNEDAENYDKWRPRYCREVFSEILRYAPMGPEQQALEVGIGTGQATEPFLHMGCEVTAVELGQDLARYTRLKFKDFRNLSVIHTSFEEYEGQENGFDLIYSATAFHWIPERIGYPKALRLLKSGGALALFWNRPFAARADDEMHQKLQTVYQTYRPSGSPPVERDENRYKSIQSALRAYGFVDVELHLYSMTRTFSGSDYLALLNTYSDHRSMPPETKRSFEHDIREAILSGGDVLHVYDTIDLYLARKG